MFQSSPKYLDPRKYQPEPILLEIQNLKGEFQNLKEKLEQQEKCNKELLEENKKLQQDLLRQLRSFEGSVIKNSFQIEELAMWFKSFNNVGKGVLWNIENIQKYFLISERHAREMIKHDLFPKPININLTGNKKSTSRWYPDDVIKFTNVLRKIKR